MTITSLFVLMPIVALPSVYNKVEIVSRTTTLVFLSAAIVIINTLSVLVEEYTISIYSGIIQVSPMSYIVDILIFTAGAIVMQSRESKINIPSELGLIILFTTCGSSLLLSSDNYIILYLALELQSFGVYIIATLNRESESSTEAGLKYFLLGGLSSCLILLGIGIIYSSTGITSLESTYTILAVSSVSTYDLNISTVGFSLIACGLLFKISSAPFHNWAPDVYNGVPTIITIWLAVIPKISILALLCRITYGINNSLQIDIIGNNYDIWKTLLITCSFLSLIVGTIVGLAQSNIKRLLAYSTISHVGFILLALTVIPSPIAISSFIFYLYQYTLTSALAFIIVLGFGYTIIENNKKDDILLISQLTGQINIRPILTIGLSVCLFSIAGVPPLIGFFGKAFVLQASLNNGYVFISIIAIIVSVISASYYLKIIRIIIFNAIPSTVTETTITISNSHSLIIAVLTNILLFFWINPKFVLTCTELLAASYITY